MTLEYLDIFIGFSAVMLGVSLIITVLTQIVTFFLGLRGRELANGLETLFAHAGLAEGKAGALADKVLRHELISDHILKIGSPRARASAIRLEELKRIVKTVAEDDAGLKAKIAEIESGADAWFNSVMDRVSQWYASKSRVVTMAFAVVVAFALQLDSIDLLRQLSEDSGLRASVAEASGDLQSTAERLLAAPASQGPGGAPPDAAASSQEADVLTGLLDELELVTKDLEQAQFRLVPQPYKSYLSWKLLLGMLISSALLSLGAPFWFNTLSTLSALRPIMAGREEAERKQGATP